MKRNLETIQLDAFSLLMKENKIHVLYSYYIYIYNYTGPYFYQWKWEYEMGTIKNPDDQPSKS